MLYGLSIADIILIISGSIKIEEEKVNKKTINKS